MTHAICIANQKGGVGKTTTAINLSEAIARAGNRVLLIDLDPQCNATTAMGHLPTENHALVGDSAIRHAMLATENEHLELLPGCRRFQDVDLLAKSDSSESGRMIEHLKTGTQLYQFVLIDCPPSLGQLTRTALSACDEVFMPIQCEYFAMEGLTQMIEVIRDVINTTDGKLQFGGILLTMYDKMLELTAEVDSEVREFFGEIVFQTVIPRDVAIAEAPSHGKSVLEYSPRSRGARAYIELCMEVMDR